MGFYGLILCGGKGERFWPLSTPERPKPFLSIAGDRSLLAQTLERVQPVFGTDRVFLLGERTHRALLEEVASELPPPHILLEPESRNTAPPAALGSLLLRRRDEEAVVAVLPSDHWVDPPEEFQETLRVAADLALQERLLLTLGIRPDRPEPGYGYVEVGEEVARRGGSVLHRVHRFREKPSEAEAAELVRAGGSYWNSGIFVWPARLFLEEVGRYLPDLAGALVRLEEEIGEGLTEEVLDRFYRDAPDISIDYGVMERSGRVGVLPVTYRWDDLGSWLSLERLRDANRLRSPGRCVELDASGCILYNDGDGVLAVYGVEDLVIVRSAGGTLVCHKSLAPHLKDLVARVQEEDE